MLSPSIAKAVAGVLAARPAVLAGYVFGSVASGRQRPDSDIDIAILADSRLMRKDPLRYRLDLMSDLGSALKRSDVDVVLMNEAPPALAHNIVTKGVLVFERSRSARIAFQVRALNVFLDTEPMRQLYLQYLKRRYRTRKITSG
jgi:predicted nucleotidyltransferase